MTNRPTLCCCHLIRGPSTPLPHLPSYHNTLPPLSYYFHSVQHEYIIYRAFSKLAEGRGGWTQLDDSKKSFTILFSFTMENQEGRTCMLCSVQV